MEFVADLHLHSKYSRAVSQDMVLPTMASWAKLKGIDILTTGDWTHPLWFREIRGQLEEANEGVYRLKKSTDHGPQSTANNAVVGRQSTVDKKEPLFLLTVEVASIYNQGGRLRRIHNLIFAPSFAVADKINKELLRRGANLMSDGRPMMGLPSKDLIELVLTVDKRAMLIPCHAWTPWFSLYGSNSGFDSIEECFGDYAKYIYGIETGLSSDPAMNWKIAELGNRSILSFSDAHSPAKMGREATVFVENGISNIKYKQSLHSRKLKSQISNNPISYSDIAAAIRQDSQGRLRIGYTIEFYPQEGKYHYTGHRNCKVVQSPEETKLNGINCPVCHRPLTVGVEHRVQQLAQLSVLGSRLSDAGQSVSPFTGQPKTDKPDSENRKQKTDNRKEIVDEYGVTWVHHADEKNPPYVSLVPLLEIIKEALQSSEVSTKVKDLYLQMTKSLGTELDLLLRTPIANIEKAAGPRVAQGVEKVRKREIVVIPGYDGLYGVVKIWGVDEAKTEARTKSEENSQLGLF